MPLLERIADLIAAILQWLMPIEDE